MKLHELSNNKIVLEKTLKFFNKTEETDDGYITWCDGKGIPHLQVNMYNQAVYILTDHFRNLLDSKEFENWLCEKYGTKPGMDSERAERERKEQFDPFYLDPKVKQVELGRKIGEKKSSSQGYTEEEEGAKKKQERLPLGERVNIDYVVSIDEYLTDYERDMFENAGDRGYIGLEHLLSECDPMYIDRYTTAYNSDIMRAILSHQ